MDCKNNFIGFNRELNRNRLRESRVLSRQDNFNATRALKEEPEPDIKITVTSREIMLQKWKAQKELKKKERELKKPAFIVPSTSKIPSTIPFKVKRDLSLQKTSFNKTKLPYKNCEKNIVTPRLLSHKTIPQITTSLPKLTLSSKKCENIVTAPISHKTVPKVTTSLPKPTLSSKKCENIVTAPISHKTVPKSNLPTIKTSASTSNLKPSKQPVSKANFSDIPKTNFYKTVPKLFLFGHKNTEKPVIKSNFDKNRTKITVPVSQASFSSCNISQIYSKVDYQKIQNSNSTLSIEDSLVTPNPKTNIRTSTPLKETDLSMQKSKNEDPATVTLSEDISYSVKHSSISEINSPITEKLDVKTTETFSNDNKNTPLKEKVQLSLITHSLNEEFEQLKVDEGDSESCKSKEILNNTISKDFESRMQTPISLPCLKDPETDPVTPRRSERLKKNTIYSKKNLQSIATASEVRLIDTESSQIENLRIDITKDSKFLQPTTSSLPCIKTLKSDNPTPRRSQRLKEKNESQSCENLQNNCKSEEKQIDNSMCSKKLIKKSESEDSYEDLLKMPRPSMMGFDTDESLDSPLGAASNISYDFDNLDSEDHMFYNKNEKNMKKVSLLYDPERRQTRLTSIKGDLMTFSSPE